MKDIIVEFSGWLRIAPKDAKFVCIGSDGTMNFIVSDINGEQWLALDENARADYVLEDVIAVQRDAHYRDYVQIDVFEDDSI